MGDTQPWPRGPCIPADVGGHLPVICVHSRAGALHRSHFPSNWPPFPNPLGVMNLRYGAAYVHAKHYTAGGVNKKQKQSQQNQRRRPSCPAKTLFFWARRVPSRQDGHRAQLSVGNATLPPLCTASSLYAAGTLPVPSQGSQATSAGSTQGHHPGPSWSLAFIQMT